jgi:hypothetical protein
MFVLDHRSHSELKGTQESVRISLIVQCVIVKFCLSAQNCRRETKWSPRSAFTPHRSVFIHQKGVIWKEYLKTKLILLFNLLIVFLIYAPSSIERDKKYQQYPPNCPKRTLY